MSIKKLFFLCVITVVGSLYSRESDKHEVGQMKIGNLALPGSQQPGPLVGFGQNIVDRYDLQMFVFVGFLKGHRKNFTEVGPSIVYGIRDNLSLFIELPIAASFTLNGQHSSGQEDLLIQLEYAFYTYETETCTDELTLVTSFSLPSGNDCKEPETGFGSPSFFLGATASHLATDWYYYVSPGVLLTTKYGNNTKSGNQFFYQAGFGRNIAYCPDKWILA